jgi:hypothetical protein
MTNEHPEARDGAQTAEPLALRSNDQLGPLVDRLRGCVTMKHETALMRDAADALADLWLEHRALLEKHNNLHMNAYRLRRENETLRRGPWIGRCQACGHEHEVPKEEARLLSDALQALCHYRAQTRPIADCDAVIDRLSAVLRA